MRSVTWTVRPCGKLASAVTDATVGNPLTALASLEASRSSVDMPFAASVSAAVTGARSVEDTPSTLTFSTATNDEWRNQAK